MPKLKPDAVDATTEPLEETPEPDAVTQPDSLEATDTDDKTLPVDDAECGQTLETSEEQP